MNKKLLIILLGVSFMTLTGCGCSKKEETKTETNSGVNSNENVIKDQTVESFNFTNTALVYENGSSTLTTSVYNTSDSTEYIKSFNIIVKDASGNVVEEMLGYIGSDIPSKETRVITSSSSLDLTKAASIEYTINK